MPEPKKRVRDFYCRIGFVFGVPFGAWAYAESGWLLAGLLAGSVLVGELIAYAASVRAFVDQPDPTDGAST